MPSRLSSLLVRDGLVGVKRMEKAFQRQVIYGGSLDTILLEMSLVPEERLTQYLALASGLPPAARDEGVAIARETAALVSPEIASHYRAVPLAAEGETLRLLVCSPLEIAELEDLADELDRPLQPLITPEYRWHLAYALAYGVDAPARFTTLARALEVDPTAPPVGRARSVIIEDRAASAAPISELADITEKTPALADETTKMAAPVPSPTTPAFTAGAAELAAAAIAQPADPDPTRERTPTLVGIKALAGKPATPSRTGSDTIVDALPGGGRPITLTPAATVTPSTGVPRPVPESGPAKRPSRRIRPLAAAGTLPITTEGRDGPLPVVTARAMLATAEDRDSVFLTLLRAVRGRARWAGLLTVQGGAAIGRVALAEPGLDTAAINTVLIPLDAASPFQAVISSHQPYVGPVISGDPSIDAMALRLGGSMPPSALLLPIVLRDRVVALVVAHRVHSDLRIVDVTEVLPLAIAASEAIGRLIVRHKSAGYRVPVNATQVEIDSELVDTKRYNAVTPDGSPWRAPAPSAVPKVEGLDDIDVPISTEPTRSIEAVLDEIEQAPEARAEDAFAEAIERAAETLGPLHRRFPGKLRVDRFAVGGRPLRAAQYGGLLELVIRLGSSSAELLIDKMGSPHRDVRFYAVVCTTELRPRNAVFALAERLFDQDFGVRACAIEALAGYPIHDLGSALARARRAARSSDPEVVAAATAALVELGDVEAIGEMISVLERGDRTSDHARRALISLTAQDFGTNGRKWRKWHDGARRRHRIEWLIDGLTHKEDAIRETAINDLRRLTGEYFGYHHDLPRRERDAAAVKWVAWWRDVGQRRFVHGENERHRPTAVLPARRD